MKDFFKNKILTKQFFILFFLVMLFLNIMLPNTMNYDNIILKQEYEKYGLEGITASYAQVYDNETKVNEFPGFLSKVKAMILVVSILFFIAFIVFNFKKLDIAKIFLIVSVPIGLLYIFLVPIGCPPDEQAHFYKAYEVSKGYMVSDKNENNLGGRKLPTILKRVVTDDYLIPGKPVTGAGVLFSYNEWMGNYKNFESAYKGDEEFLEFSNTAIYCPVAYFPQALGIILVRAFSGSYLAQARAARLVNYLAFVLVMFYAMKKLPFKKVAMFLIAMLPITFQEVTSMAIDGMQMAFATLLISYTLYLTYDETKEKLNWKDYVILTVSCIFTAITKMLYVPLCLIIFIIPKDKFKNVKVKYIALIAIFVVALLLDGMVMYHSLSYKNTFAREDSDTVGQVIHIVKHPLAFVNTILLTVQKSGMKNVFGIFGQALCWEDLDISSAYILSLFVVTMYFLYVKRPEGETAEDVKIEDSKKVANFITKAFMFIIAAGTSFGLALASYATLCPVGYEYILGIQGRYYIPMLVLYAVSLTKISKRKEDLKGIEYLMMFMIFANLDTLVNILFRYL